MQPFSPRHVFPSCLSFSFKSAFFVLAAVLVLLASPQPSPAQGDNTSELRGMIMDAAGDWQGTDFDRMLSLLDIEKGKQADGFLALVDQSLAATERFANFPERDAFAKRLIGELDARRFAKVDALLGEVAAKYPGLEAAVRTGSSGYRHLGVEGAGYRPLFSDDDITFVGQGADEAKAWFNSQLEKRGLSGVKVKGFTLNDPGKYSPLDKAVLDLLDPEKFVGQSAMSGIRSETLKKGAVVLGKDSSGKLVFMHTSLADYIGKTKTLKSALESFVEDAARRYGPLSMVSSVERQIVSAHKGWENLTSSEQIKYVLRARKKVAEGLGGVSDGSIESLEQMAAKFSKFPPPVITPEETAFLLARRKDNLIQAFEATNNRLMALVERNSGPNMAANAEVRAAVNELATSFAMLKNMKGGELGQLVDVDEVIADLLRNAGGNPELRRVLYTANLQADDMLRVLREWGSNEEGFAKMLDRLAKMTQAQQAKELEKSAQTLERKAQAGTITQAEARQLSVVREMSATAAKPEGGKMILGMTRNQAAKAALVGLAMTGGAYVVTKMYDRWKDGGYYEDLSGAAAALVEFAPGAMSFAKLKQEGYLSPSVAYQFVKEGMYLTWLWPAAMAADVVEMGLDLSQGLALTNYHDGLVDVLAANGRFENGRFVALELAGGESIGREALAGFLREDRQVRVKNTNNPNLTYATNLSKAAAEVYAKYYVENDPVLAELKKALIQQIGKINVTEGMKQFSEASWIEAAKSGFRMLFAVEGVCQNAPKYWCDLVKIYQGNIVKRTEDIFPRVMVPHLISLAEEGNAALSGSNDAVKRIMKIQREIEELRGSPLGVDLGQEAAQRAAKTSDLRATAISGDTSTARDKALAEGRYLQAALLAYETILKEARQSLENAVSRTGYTGAQQSDAAPRAGKTGIKVLGFKFSGDFYQDATRARQSRRGFMADTNKIVQDVAKIKGSNPDVLNETDVTAMGYLAEVAYPFRTTLDEGNAETLAAPANPATAAIPDLKPPVPSPDSPFHGWYRQALEKAKALYAAALDLRKLVAMGAMIVPPGSEMLENTPGTFEVRLTAQALRSLWDERKLDLEWTSNQSGGAFAAPGSLKTAFTPSEAGNASVTATFLLKAEPAVQASIKASIPVRAATKPTVSIALTPNPPMAGGTATATASVDSATRSAALDYRWSCSGCTLTKANGPSAVIEAPKSGRATVSVKVAGTSGARGEILAESALAFTVKDDPKPEPKDASKTEPKKDVKDDLKDKQTQSGADANQADGKPDRQPEPERPRQTPDAAGQPGADNYRPFPTPRPNVVPEPETTSPRYPTQSGATAVVPGQSGFASSQSPDAAGRTTSGQSQAQKAEAAPPAPKKLTPIDQITPEQRKKLLDCLCLWSCTLYVAYYDPLTKGDSPSCQDLSNGPCTGGEWGCSRFPLAPRADRPKEVLGCYESNGIAYDKTKADGLVSEIGAKYPKKPAETDKKAEDKPLTVAISRAGPPNLTPGQTVELSAQAQGGKPPYVFSWTGAVPASGATVAFKAPAKPGSFSFTATVKDADGKTASQTMAVKTTGIEMTLRKSSPAETKLAVGAEARFEASLTSEGKPVPASDYVIRWEPSTEVRFAKAEGQGATSNSAVFVRPGSAKVWAVALAKDGPSLFTAAESNQIALEVTGSAIALTVSPLSPLVGQEVTVTAVETPKIADSEATYWWNDSLGGAGTGPTANQRQWKFTPKEAKPVTVSALLKGKSGGEELAKASVTVTPVTYKVEAVALGPAFGKDTTRPVIWKQGVGLVTLDKEIGPFEDVGFRADVTPAPANQPLRYKWTINEGTSLSGNPAARETRAQRQSRGSIEATVEVRDAKDAVLGKATASAQVSYSEEDVKTGKQKAAELAKFKDEAAKAWSAGELDPACDKAKAAAQIDPKVGEAKTYCDGRDRIRALVKEAEGMLGKSDLDKAGLDKAKADLESAKAVNAKAKELAELERKIKEAQDKTGKADAALAAAEAKWKAGDPEGAAAGADEALKLEPKHQKALEAKQRYADGMAKLKASLAKAKALEGTSELDKALAAVAEGKAVNAAYKPLADLEKEIAAKKDKAGAAAKSVAEAKSAWDAGDLDAACAKAQSALALDAALEAAKQEAKRDCEGKDKAAALARQAEAEIASGQGAKAREHIEEIKKINAKGKMIADLEKKLGSGVDKLLAEAARKWNDGDAEGALAAAEAAFRDSPGDARAKSARQEYLAKLTKLQESLGAAKSRLDRKEYDAAQAALVEAKALNPGYKPLAVLGSEIEKAKTASLAQTPAKEASGVQTPVKSPPDKPGSAPQGASQSKPEPARPTANKEEECKAGNNEGTRKYKENDFRGAIDEFTKVLKSCPDSCKAMNNIGAAWKRLDQPAQAMAWYEKAHQCEPGKAKYQENIDNIRQQLAKPAQAAAPQAPAQAATQAANKEEECKAGNNEGIRKYKEKDFQGAIGEFTKVLKLCPDYCKAMNNIGTSFDQLDQLPKALEWYERALQCEPSSAKYKENIDKLKQQMAKKVQGVAPQAVPQPAKQTATGPEVVIFKLESLGGVSGNPPQKTVFTLNRPARITKIMTYHFNGGRGAQFGTIGLRDTASGKMVGNWNAGGEGAGKTLYWYVRPNVDLPPGSYEVVDSDRATWSHNAEMGNRGCTFVHGVWQGQASGQPGQSAKPAQAGPAPGSRDRECEAIANEAACYSKKGDLASSQRLNKKQIELCPNGWTPSPAWNPNCK